MVEHDDLRMPNSSRSVAIHREPLHLIRARAPGGQARDHWTVADQSCPCISDPRNLQYDLHYIREQNLMLDGAILLRTIAAVVHGVGAV